MQDLVSRPSALPSSPAASAAADPETTGKSPAAAVALVIVTLMALFIGWLAAADRLAPYSGSGVVSANTTHIAPRVSGQVRGVFVEDNQYVDAGAPLFELDPAPFDLALRQARANLVQVEQAIDINRANLSAARASLANAESALAQARSEEDRTRSLFERGIATKVQTDRAEAARIGAESALRVARSNLERASLAAGEKDNPQLDAARAQLELAQLNREFATVTAPASGYVTNLQLTRGEFVPVGRAAMTFIASDRLWVSTDLRENQLANVEPGDPVTLMFDARPGELFRGEVKSVAWGIDTGRISANGLPQNKSSARWFEPARRIPVRIDLSGDQWPEHVRIGSKVTSVIYAEGESGLIARIGHGLHRLQSIVSYIY